MIQLLFQIKYYCDIISDFKNLFAQHQIMNSIVCMVVFRSLLTLVGMNSRTGNLIKIQSDLIIEWRQQ